MNGEVYGVSVKGASRSCSAAARAFDRDEPDEAGPICGPGTAGRFCGPGHFYCRGVLGGSVNRRGSFRLHPYSMPGYWFGLLRGSRGLGRGAYSWGPCDPHLSYHCANCAYDNVGRIFVDAMAALRDDDLLTTR